MIYLTYGNQSDGVYDSYVIDICNYMNQEFNANIKIIALISFRNFFNVRKRRKKMYSNSVILPAFPKLRFWKLNIISLLFVWVFSGRKKVMALSPIACNLALMLKKIKVVKTVIYDGEGATSAEWNEYKVVSNRVMEKKIHSIEKNAVINSHFRRAVSSEMVKYWKKRFAYSQYTHTIIPCTLNDIFKKPFFLFENIQKSRLKNNYSENDIIFVYSGSSAGWQSLNLAEKYLLKVFEKYSNTKLLILSDIDSNELEIYKNFPERVKILWVEFEQVPKYLSFCDYGVLIRENSITNQVSAPTKFAEYLSCGLNVLISEHVGDYSEFTKKNNCGIIIDKQNKLFLPEKTGKDAKQKLHNLAIENFSNHNYIESFKKITELK